MFKENETETKERLHGMEINLNLYEFSEWPYFINMNPVYNLYAKIKSIKSTNHRSMLPDNHRRSSVFRGRFEKI